MASERVQRPFVRGYDGWCNQVRRSGMSEENKIIARRYFEEAVNKGMLSVVDE